MREGVVTDATTLFGIRFVDDPCKLGQLVSRQLQTQFEDLRILSSNQSEQVDDELKPLIRHFVDRTAETADILELETNSEAAFVRCGSTTLLFWCQPIAVVVGSPQPHWQASENSMTRTAPGHRSL